MGNRSGKVAIAADVRWGYARPMKSKAKIVIGKPDPEALKNPQVAKLWTDEFEQKLLAGVSEAKAAALRRQSNASARSATY